MNVRLHVALDQFFNFCRLVAPLLVCATIGWAPIPVVALILLTYFAPLLLTWLIPVDCISTGCTGRMQLTTERRSFWLVSVLYKCDNCGTVYQAEIFNPNVEITVEFF